MQRALTSGVSGMLNNQLVLDVTANNLANVNTTGFKASRVSFSNALIQTEFSGSAPGTAVGGQDPRQVGLGMQTSTISLDMRQGSLQSTGRNLDLAIQGEGFFKVTDGTRSLYSRVGNFGFDSGDNFVDLGTGYKVVGNTYSTQVNPDGTQSVLDINQPLNIPRNEAFPPKRTETVTMQGNLGSETPALRGSSLTSLFALYDTVSGRAATQDSRLQDLSIFKGAAGLPGATLPMTVFGTKPNGEAYAGTFAIHPWDTPSAANGQIGSVSELLDHLNQALAQGSQRFGNVSIDNGKLVASGVGTGDGFSMFVGENPAGNSPISAQPNYAALNGSIAYTGTPIAAPPGGTDVVGVGEIGLLNPTFTIPANDLSAQVGASMRVSVQVNGQERGTITIPAADYSAAGAVTSFSLPSLPHVAQTDVVTYNFSGTLNLGGNVSWSTKVVDDTDRTNLTADVDGDRLPDMFEENSSIDVNAWVYRDGTNTTFNWYRARMTPGAVSSSIEVFDAQGGRHTVDAQYLRTGTRTDPATGQRFNVWDLIVGSKPGDAQIVDDVVAGIQFDQQGRFTGSVGTSAHNTSFSDTGYVGDPGSGTVEFDWATTGPTTPAVMTMNFGESNSFKGLTSFGSGSTAAAVTQDGYSDGKLDTLSVSTEGDIIGLYTNGISRKLAQLPLAVFRNPGGLTQEGNNLFHESVNSGSATLRDAGTGAGFITAGALEGGNVDIATEFTRIITAQRGFQVSARVIQTTDKILEELANLTR